MLVAGGALLVLAGCAGARPTQEDEAVGTPTRATTSAKPKPTQTSAAPAVTRDGPCPYFDADFAEQTVGQHMSRSTITTTSPNPGCTFYRPDGGKAIDVQVSSVDSAVVAQQKAIDTVGANANPVNGIGDGGVVAIVSDGARIAVSKGKVLVVVWINQQVSLQARDIAAAVIAKVRG